MCATREERAAISLGRPSPVSAETGSARASGGASRPEARSILLATRSVSGPGQAAAPWASSGRVASNTKRRNSASSPRLRARPNPRLDLRRQILVREIDRRFEMRHKPQEPLAPAAIDPAEMAVELAQGLAALRLRFGRREIGDRLGLGQVELVVQKGAAGEF